MFVKKYSWKYIQNLNSIYYQHLIKQNPSSESLKQKGHKLMIAKHNTKFTHLTTGNKTQSFHICIS